MYKSQRVMKVERRRQAAKLGHTMRALAERALRQLGRPPGPRWPALTPVANLVERGVHVLDSALPIPGTRLRLGLDPLLGLLLPVAGDALAGVVSLSVLFLAVQYRVPSKVIGTMVFNVAVDAAVGGIPIVGDLFDFAWKANERNFDLMMKHRGDVNRRGTVMYYISVAGLLVLGLACIVAPIGLLVWLYLRFFST
ncbi:MAG: DUF4112 domain-containing protein [Polyangiales bacterium]